MQKWDIYSKGLVETAVEEGVTVDGHSMVSSNGWSSDLFPGSFPLSVMTSGANARHIEAAPSFMMKLGLNTLTHVDILNKLLL